MDQATKLPLRASYILGVNLKNRDKSKTNILKYGEKILTLRA